MCGIFKNGRFEGKKGLYIGTRAGQLEMESLTVSSERLSRSSESPLADIMESDHETWSHRPRGHKIIPASIGHRASHSAVT